MTKRVTISKAEIKRRVEAVIETGLPVARVEIEGDRVSIYTSADDSLTDLQKWEAESGEGGDPRNS